AAFIITIPDPDLAKLTASGTRSTAKAHSADSKTNSPTTPRHSTAGSHSAPSGNVAEHGNGLPPTASAPSVDRPTPAPARRGQDQKRRRDKTGRFRERPRRPVAHALPWL